MAVDSVTSSTASSNPWANAAASSTDSDNASLNYDSFLQLLIAQMKNQDPTDPMDASEQIAQLATFSQVEQSIQTNTHLKSLLQAEAITRAGDTVGKYIMSADDSTTGKVKEVQVYSDGIIAVTEDGDKILLQAGVVISDEEIDSTSTDTDTDTATDTSTDTSTSDDSST